MKQDKYRLNAILLLIAFALLTGRAQAADKYWAPSSGNGWNTGANWSPSGVPGSGDVAIFDGGTSSGDCLIDVNANAVGVLITNAYGGTITQGSGRTVTVGTSNYVQYAGTFTGSDTNIVVGGLFTLAGGTFTSTSGKLAIGRVFSPSENRNIFVVSNGATFVHNSGTVEFKPQDDGGWDYTDLSTYLYTPAGFNLNHVIINGLPGGRDNNDSTRVASSSGNPITVLGDLTQTDGAIDATFEVQGNLVVGANADGGTGTIRLASTGAQTYLSSGAGSTANLVIDKSAGSVTPQAGSTHLSLPTFSLLAGTFNAPTGTMTVGRQADNETFFSVAPGATFSHNNGTVAFSPRQNGDGSDVFTVDVDGSLILNHIIVNGRPGGHNDLYSCQITPASGDALTAAGNFTHTDGILLGTWDVRGNLSVGSLADEGSGTLTLNGADDQTYAYTSGAGAGRLVIDKAASSVSPAAGVGSLRCAALIVRTGTFHAPTGTLSVGKEQEFADATIFSVSNTAAFVHNDGTVNFIPKRHIGWDGPGVTLSLDTPAGFTLNHLIVNARQDGRSDEIMTRLSSASGHAIDVLGNLTHTDGILDVPLRVRRDVAVAATADGGTGTVALAGALDQTLTRQTNGSPAGGTWTIDKSGGTVTLATDVPLTSTGQQLVWTNGALDLSSNTLTVAGAVTIYPGATTLGVTVADTNRAGRLTCSNTVSGLANVGLEVSVTAPKEQSPQIEVQTYTILSNTNVLAAPFETEKWVGNWRGSVDYSASGGKSVTLSNVRSVPPGTVLIVQ